MMKRCCRKGALILNWLTKGPDLKSQCRREFPSIFIISPSETRQGVKWSFYSKTYIIIPTCTYDFAQPPNHPTLIPTFFPVRVLSHAAWTYAWQSPHRQPRYLTPHPPILARQRQAGERGEDGRESSYVQVGMII